MILGMEQISAGATAIGFTESNYNKAMNGVKMKANSAILTVEVAQVRFRIDGTAPTASIGHVLNANDAYSLLTFEQISNFKAIRTGATNALLTITYIS